MNPRHIIADYYCRQDVQDAMIKFGKDREVVGVFRSGSFSSRPNVILYPKEIMAMVRTGVIEFHSSVERWRQPMSLRSDNYESLRKGWDLLFDMDCEVFEHGKLASEVVIWAFKKHGIRNVSVKFTGGTGFHIGVPWESIPREVNYRKTVEQYPSLARTIAEYIKDYARDRMEKVFFDKYCLEEQPNLEALSKQINVPLSKLQTEEGIDPYKIVDIDPILISPRHLFRMPYSLNKKTFLVSLPVRPQELGDFQKEDSRPEKLKPLLGFLNNGEPGEAELLVAEAMDWNSMKKEKKKASRRIIAIEGQVDESMFPPCIKKIKEGLPDGRKRSMFILINFLRTMNWTWDRITKYVEEWNARNKPPLHENYVRSQLRWHTARTDKVPPPNCDSPGRYIDIGVCKPDQKCGGEARTIKNPVNYSKKLYFREKPKKETKPRKPRKRKDPMDYPVAKP
ncbi:MAG: hypothetical protein JW754_05695 [Candidatus Aenigmarchaeota archaeon]|nr:hypothetical protein [Candidatus Aenigmarchaeota archaeon]